MQDVGRGLRAVAWERTAGQVVQAVLTIARPARAAVARALVHAARGWSRWPRRPSASSSSAGRGAGGGRSRWARVRNAVAADIRAGLLRRKALPAVVLASAVVVLGHAVTFLVAARTAGVTAPALAAAAAGAARDAGHGAAERRRLGAARGGDRVGVRRGRPRCGSSAPRPPSPTASWCSPPACQGRSCSSQGGSPGGGRRRRRARADRRAAERSRGCVTARTPSSPAACRSTATSATAPRGCSCPTRRTSTASTPSAPPATRSSSGRRPFGSTTPGSSCARRLVATSGPRGASRRRR